jgi:hypothetical protein
MGGIGAGRGEDSKPEAMICVASVGFETHWKNA